MKFLSGGLSAAILVGFLSGRAAVASGSCESLASLIMQDATITTAATVAAGAFRPPAAASAGGEEFKSLPSFCRVAVTLRPSRDSDIKVEVWMPASDWNGKFQAVGNGGWAGAISYGAMSRALAHGYATSSTDTGHTGGSASFALGHPEKLADYAYRSEHEMTVKAKAVIDAFYGAGPKHSYWNGCSTGGRQALTETQRFPDDYDGIIAGAAANPKTHLDAWRIWMAQAMFKDEASVIPVTKFPMIHKAVLAACDEIDGLKDGLIDDPTKCHFDPQVLECKSGDAPSCLTAAQVTAAQVVMSPVKDRKAGGEIFPGFEPGTELGWERMLSGPDPYGTALDQFKYIVFGNPR
jgi:feruloyl esterase